MFVKIKNLLPGKTGNDFDKKTSQRLFGLFFLWIMFYSYTNSRAGQGVAITGVWGSNLTWNFGGVNRLPTCGDTLTIPAGVIVTISTQLDYTSCGQNMFISVSGTLQFMNGYKLDMPCSSSVVINNGGVLKKATAGGGNSTFIKMCGCTSWTAADGSVSGPQTLNCSLLPIELLNFSAETTEEGIALTWTTASETNNQYFTCEHSINGEEFYSVGDVRGAGNSTVIKEYSLVDKTPSEGRNFYRLRQTDYDGAITYSESIAITYKSNSSLNIVNTYFDDSGLLNIVYKNNLKKLNIKLYNISGKEVFTQDILSTIGLNRIFLNIPGIMQGSYMLILINAEKSIRKKIFIAQ